MSLTYAAARALLKPLVDRQIHIRAEVLTRNISTP